ncbi:hypothetical protein LSTR_LSTR016571 [Laodelphax striatellus]|uniref:Uncharacterized protein n=1 Tax=Laodelphax striatellus TaxID=195883 RepID=A0A482WNJ5_LAOST|nr:hypothetical protein LSTR_LSTR016571 [Laodelphax striatellus]
MTNATCIQATTTLIQEKMQDVGKIYVLNGKKLRKDRESFVGKSVEVKRLAALESSDANCRGVNRVLVFPESSGW